MTSRGRDVLAQVPLFAGLPPRFLKKLADRMDEQRFMEGATIVKLGDPGESFYVILEGEARVTNDSGRTLASLVPGDFFGEISLIDGGPRTANVVAATNLTALALARNSFRGMLENEPRVAAGLLRHAAGLLRRLERPKSG